MHKSAKKLLILGAGGFGQTVYEVAAAQNKWQDIYFVDDRWPLLTQVNQIPVICNIEGLKDLNHAEFQAICAVGNNEIRELWFETLEKYHIELINIIDPHALLSPSVKIGKGCCIMAGCVINTNTVINDGVILNIGTLLDHDVIIKAFAHLSVGVKVSSGKIIAPYSFLKVGSCIPH